MPATVVLLHGFAGTGRGWDLVVERLDAQRYTALTPDIRGHGLAGDRRPVTFDACARDVLDAGPEQFDLCGYSLGGRIALHVALAAPERVRRLVLVSSTAGIRDPLERERRRAADDALAARIERGTIEQFADRWLEQPLFADDPPAAQALARADISRNDPGSIAAALRGLGAGVMEPLWDRLAELSMPVTVLAGARDRTYCEIGEQLVRRRWGADLVILEGAGHALAREAPRAVAAALMGDPIA